MTHKMSKMSGKREKLACASMDHYPKLQKPKIESGEEDKRSRRRCGTRLHGRRPNFSWSHPICHSYLQNCHYGLQNYKNATT